MEHPECWEWVSSGGWHEVSHVVFIENVVCGAMALVSCMMLEVPVGKVDPLSWLLLPRKVGPAAEEVVPKFGCYLHYYVGAPHL